MQQNFLCPNCRKENRPASIQCQYCGAPLGRLGVINARCPSCQQPRVPGDRFCGQCGQALDPICPNCGNIVSRDSRYCPKCSFFCGGGRESVR